MKMLSVVISMAIIAVLHQGINNTLLSVISDVIIENNVDSVELAIEFNADSISNYRNVAFIIPTATNTNAYVFKKELFALSKTSNKARNLLAAVTQ